MNKFNLHHPVELLKKAKMIVQKCHCYFRLQWGTCWSFALQTGDRVQEFTENESALLLTSFSINHNRQRKGYAKKSLALLQEFVQRYFPMKMKLYLL